MIIISFTFPLLLVMVRYDIYPVSNYTVSGMNFRLIVNELQ